MKYEKGLLIVFVILLFFIGIIGSMIQTYYENKYFCEKYNGRIINFNSHTCYIKEDGIYNGYEIITLNGKRELSK